MPDLKVLEQQRRSVVRKIGCVIIATASIAAIAFFIAAQSLREAGPVVIFPIIVGLLIGAGICYMLTRGYVADFKGLVIERIVRFIDENLTYSPKDCIPKSVFMLSKIFTTKPNRYKGDDLVSGKVGATQIQFSELHAEYESGSGNNRHRYTVFRGIFFVGDFNKHFTGQTIVLPDTAEKLFGRLGQKLQSLKIGRASCRERV